VTGKVEQNHLLFTRFLAFVCFADGGGKTIRDDEWDDIIEPKEK
jgi:hypothetical protein